MFAELGARTARAADRLRLMLGLRRTLVMGGVRYTERSTESLRRSLSRTGAGLKEYDAVFGDGTRLRLHCTPGRVYADLSGAVLLPRYRLVEDLLSPGMRVLELSSGTGYGAGWLVERVGPSGAVVALDRDRESIRYAQHRYAAANAAFENGGVETLNGELAGSFDAVLTLRGIEDEPSLEAALTELWRVVAPGGWMAIAEPEDIAGRAGFEDLLRRVTATVAVNSVNAAAASAEEVEAEPSDGDAGLPDLGGGSSAGTMSMLTKMQDPLPEHRATWLAMKASP